MHNPTDRTHTTAFGIPVVEHWLEREIAQWVHHEELLLPWSYISLLRYEYERHNYINFNHYNVTLMISFLVN